MFCLKADESQALLIARRVDSQHVSLLLGAQGVADLFDPFAPVVLRMFSGKLSVSHWYSGRSHVHLDPSTDPPPPAHCTGDVPYTLSPKPSTPGEAPEDLYLSLGGGGVLRSSPVLKPRR